MARDLGLANRLRAKGVKVVEISGWQTRGKELNESTKKRVVTLDHHTAGGSSGNAPSLNICIYGRSGLPGPLCNVLMGRDGTAYVIASGKANHAGAGGWKGISGNSNTLGLERENTGYNTGPRAEPWKDWQHHTAAKILAAMQEFSSSPDAEFVPQHKEWAPTRKIDCHTVKGSFVRSLVVKYLKNPADGGGGQQGDDDVQLIIKGNKRGEWWITDGRSKSHVQSRADAQAMAFVGFAKLKKNDPPEPHVLDQGFVDRIPTIVGNTSLVEMEKRLASKLSGSGTGLSEAQAKKAAADAIREVLGALG